MNIKLQNPDTAESYDISIDQHETIAVLSEKLHKHIEKTDGLIFYTYFQTYIAKRYAKRAIVEGDCVFLPDDLEIREVVNSLRHPDLPIYFRYVSIDPDIIFKHRTSRFRDIGYDIDLLQSKTVFIGGIGLLGNEIAYNMAISGLGHLQLMDNGNVDWSNIYRQPLFTKDTVYYKKVDAAKEQLEKIGGMKITTLALEVPCMTSEPSVEWFNKQITQIVTIAKESDLMVGAFDIFSARGVLQIIARYLQKPFLSVSLDPWKGESILFEPIGNYCYCCGKTPGVFRDGGGCTLSTIEAQKTISAIATRQIVNKLQLLPVDNNAWSLDPDTFTLNQSTQGGSPVCKVCGPESTLSPAMNINGLSEWIFNWMFPKEK